MALNRLTEDVNVISKLDNYPPDDPGMTPDKLKSLFDKGSNIIKDYINNTLIPQLEEQLGKGCVSPGNGTGNGIASVSLNEDYTLTINFTNGDTYTTPVPIRGEKGEKGDDGHTPIKGTDYWTTADQASIVADVLAALPDGDGVMY